MPNGRGTGLGIGSISVDKGWLLETLRTNRDQHHEAFLHACDVFQGEATRRLERLLEKVRAGEVPDYLGVRLPIPEEHVDDYDRAIGMLEHAIGDSIELGEHAYAQLVEDDWGWALSFANNTIAYASGAYQDRAYEGPRLA